METNDGAVGRIKENHAKRADAQPVEPGQLVFQSPDIDLAAGEGKQGRFQGPARFWREGALKR